MKNWRVIAPLKNWTNLKTSLVLRKRYFDLGYGITSYIKLPIQILGIGGAINGQFLNIGVMVLLYGIFCYTFGWAWVKYGWYSVDQETTNRFNPFVKEMRKAVNNRKI